MNVIIAGSRTIVDRRVVWNAIEQSGFDISTILCGMADGVDLKGLSYGINNEIEVKKYPADWKNKGKQAGILRNIEMAKNADALIAVWDGKSIGTKHMIETALKHGLKLFVKTVGTR